MPIKRFKKYITKTRSSTYIWSAVPSTKFIKLFGTHEQMMADAQGAPGEAEAIRMAQEFVRHACHRLDSGKGTGQHADAWRRMDYTAKFAKWIGSRYVSAGLRACWHVRVSGPTDVIEAVRDLHVRTLRSNG